MKRRNKKQTEKEMKRGGKIAVYFSADGTWAFEQGNHKNINYVPEELTPDDIQDKINNTVTLFRDMII
jgi:hypothetical protein